MGATVNIEFLEMFKNDWFLLGDMADMFIGGNVGTGNSRSVYDFTMDPKYVVKIDRNGNFDNVAEWDIWNNIPEDLKKWFAPCLRISQCGRLLIQEKTTPVQLEDMPKEIPAFFQDFKLQNWGKIGENIVCHDYANHKFFSKDHGMMEPEWWSDTYQVRKPLLSQILIENESSEGDSHK